MIIFHDFIIIMSPTIISHIKIFPIWPQNLNRIAFDPVLNQKKAENWQNTQFCQFQPSFCQKWGQVLSNLNFETGYGILS